MVIDARIVVDKSLVVPAGPVVQRLLVGERQRPVLVLAAEPE